MITFYGGKTISINDDDDDNSAQMCEGVTHAFSVLYDEASKLLETRVASVKLVTPDWLVDSLLADKLVDEASYHPKYLKNNPELVGLLESIEKGNLLFFIMVNGRIFTTSFKEFWS